MTFLLLIQRDTQNVRAWKLFSLIVLKSQMTHAQWTATVERDRAAVKVPILVEEHAGQAN